MEDSRNEIKVAVLEQRVEDFSAVLSKLDAAIEKLSEVNSNVSRMLAVHEERISKQEEIDSILFDKIDKLRDKMDIDHNLVTSRIQLLERKLWAAIAALGIIVVSTNPGAIRILKPLITSDSGAILRPVATLVNGSN
jgi:Zn-dependent oligopeptidase